MYCYNAKTNNFEKLGATSFMQELRASFARMRVLQEKNKDKIEEKLKIEEAREQKRIDNEQMELLRVPRELYYKSLSDYKIQNDTCVKAYNAIKNLIKNKSGTVVLLGANGLGKSMLGAIAVKALAGVMLSMCDISLDIRDINSQHKSEKEYLQRLSSEKVLFIDEIGRSTLSRAEGVWLSYIMKRRHYEGLPTILASNAHTKVMCKNGGNCPGCFHNVISEDIVSLLCEDAKIIQLTGKDYRRMTEQEKEHMVK